MPNYLKVGSVQYNIDKIAENAFYRGVTAPTNLVTAEINTPYVNQLAFQGCSGINKVIIGPDVKNISFNAFKDCINLETMAIKSNGINLFNPNSEIIDPHNCSVSVFKEIITVKVTGSDPYWFPIIDSTMIRPSVDYYFYSEVDKNARIELWKTDASGNFSIIQNKSEFSLTATDTIHFEIENYTIDEIYQVKIAIYTKENKRDNYEYYGGNPKFSVGKIKGVQYLIDCEENELLWIAPYKTSLTNYNEAVKTILKQPISRIPPYIFANNNGITSLIIPTNITSIGYHAFEECKNLYNVLVEGGRTEPLIIEDYAFHKCGSGRSGEPAAITLANTHTTIGNRALAFEYSENDEDPGEEFTDILLNILVVNTPPDGDKVVKIHQNAFIPLGSEDSNITRINVIHVENDGLDDLYKNDANWKVLEDKIEFISTQLIHTIKGDPGIKVTRIGDTVELDFDYIEFYGGDELLS